MTFYIGTPHSRGAGYFINDQKLSTRQEADIRTCTHCQSIIKMQEWKIDGAWCGKCNAPICSNQACIAKTARYGCIPFIKEIEAASNAAMKIDRFIKLAGLDSPAPAQSIFTG